MERRIAQLKEYGRPLLCTEFMARGNGSTFEAVLPILKREKVAAYCWGLVDGKTQTKYPWPTDGLWSSVGSTNFDNRSFALNDEANLNVIDSAFALEQEAIFEKDKGQARQITLDRWRRRPRMERFMDWLSGLLRAQL
jgi:hypothetical protein